jgi:hypothetical protein
MVDLLVIESLEDGRNFSTQEWAGCSVNGRSGRHKMCGSADEYSLQQLE